MKILSGTSNLKLSKEISIELEKQLDVDYIFISSVANQGILELKEKLWHMLNS